MTGSWFDAIIIGTMVGLLFSIVPRVRDFFGMLRLVRYINMDLIHFQQLLETNDPTALAFPLSRKLAEKGVLLSWSTQRTLARLRIVCEQKGFPFAPEDFDLLRASLETYRETVAAMSDRIGIVAWHTGAEYDDSMPPFVTAALKKIDAQWREFSRYSAFLEKFFRTHAHIPTERM